QRRSELPPRERLPEQRRARADQGMRGGQRRGEQLRQGSPVPRQHPRKPGHGHRGPAHEEEEEVMESSAGQPKVVMPRRFQGRISTVRAGALTILVLIVGVYLAFTKTLPWQQPFEFSAMFQTGNNLRLDSPVR